MFVLRGIRSVTRGILGLLAVVPVAALVLAGPFDRGPAGEPRVSFFPMALLALDPFVWTCARNSLTFAVLVTALSLVAGVGLGWFLARLRFWGQPVLRASSGLLPAASPVVLALGLLGIWGTPGPWPWPISSGRAVEEGVSLETWPGIPLWIFWIWSTLPAAVAIVMLSIASAVERIEPAWEDASQLAGAGRFRSWRRLIWPMIRPASVRAAALIFPIALVEPGAPLILGLRRTLAFQIVEAARRPEPFPRIAVWAIVAGLMALAGGLLLLKWGGPSILGRSTIDRGAGSGHRLSRRAGIPMVLASLLTLVGMSVLGWLPVLGLFRMILHRGPVPFASDDGATRPFAEFIGKVWDPPTPQLAANSVLLGLEIATGIVILGWLVRPDLRGRTSRTDGPNLVRRLAMMPPLLQGVGIMAFPWLAGMISSWLRSHSRFTGSADRVADLSRALSPERNPWILLVFAVGLTIGLRLLRMWQSSDESESVELRSGLDAALLAGASPRRARNVACWRPARWFGRFLLVTSFAATSLTPALLFTPWLDGRTIAPALVVLADGPDVVRIQAAFLALCLLAANVAALIAARLTSAWPRDGETDWIW
ncbi:MAG: ABC transporter permease [Isosphaeraceae bacterium]